MQLGKQAAHAPTENESKQPGLQAPQKQDLETAQPELSIKIKVIRLSEHLPSALSNMLHSPATEGPSMHTTICQTRQIGDMAPQ